MAKPKCKASEVDNTFFIMGDAYAQLCKAGKENQAKFMLKQIEKSEGLFDFLDIVSMYVRLA